MSASPYRVFGTSTPPMLARRVLFTELCRSLDRPSPENVSVIGPKYYGKTVVLHHLADTYCPGRKGPANFVTAFYWDLSSLTPTSDIEFLRGLAERTNQAFSASAPELVGFIDPSASSFQELLDQLVYVYRDELASKQGRWVLGVLDGLGRAFTQQGISRNLWDNLRILASETALRLVTGSRLPLVDLCMTEDASSSDFWRVFNTNPLRVGCFGSTDWDDLLDPFGKRGTPLDSSARKEIENWTGGVPLLTIGLLDRLYERTIGAKSVSKAEVGVPHEKWTRG